MKSIFLLFAFIFASVFSIQAQEDSHTCALSCRVLDAQTQEPLPNATIWIDALQKGEVTDINGYANIEGSCAAGEYELTIQYVGYHSVTKRVKLGKEKVLTIHLAADEHLLQEVSIVGHGEATPLKTLSVSNVDVQQLTLTQSEGLSKSLESISGVQTLRTGNHVAKPIIHGLHSNRVLILNNGIRQEGQQWGAEHAPEIDAFAAERLSVIKGAATVQYGAEALGGVVLAQPAALPTSGGLGGGLHTTYHSNGRMGAVNAFLEGGLGNIEGLGFRLQASKKRGGDARAPEYWLTNTGIDETGFSASIGMKRHYWGIDAYYSYFQNTTGILAATSVLGSLGDLVLAMESETPARTQDEFSYEIGLPRQEASHHLFKLEGFVEGGSGKHLHWQYGFQSNLRQEYDRRLGEALSVRPVINLQIQTHTLDLDYTGWNIGRWQGTIGGNFAYKDNDNLPGTGRIPFIPNHNSLEGGVFLIQRSTWDRLSVEAGLRYDVKYFNVRGRDYRNDLFSAEQTLYNLTATVGATYELSPYAKLTSNLGTAWRAPNMAELYAFGKKQGVGAIEYGLLIGERTQILSWGEQEIPNEQGLKWVGSLQYEKGNWKTEATAYVNWIQNYLYLNPQGVTVNVSGPYPYYRYEQTNVLFSGIDADIARRIGQRWNYAASLSLLWAEDIQNKDELPLIPANRLQNTLSYTLPSKGNWEERVLEFQLQYTARATQVPSRVLSIPELAEALLERGVDLVGEGQPNFDFMPPPDAYVLLNFKLGGTIRLGEGARLNIQAKGSNLLNTRYRRYTNRLRYFADEPGRNFTLSAKLLF